MSAPACGPRISRASVQRAYRAYAPFYDWLFGAVYEDGRRALGRAVAALAPRTVLEVGVGTGLTLRQYPRTAAVTGIDLSEEMIEIARRRAGGVNGHRVDLRRMDAEDMQLPDHSFDCVTLPYVLPVTPDPDQLCAEVQRVCRPGGTIFLLNHFSGAAGWRPIERLLRGAAARVGFRSDFSYEAHVLGRDWQVRRVTSANIWGLSKLVEIRNP